MKIVRCSICGGNELYEENGYLVCSHCGSKHKKTKEDVGARESTIDLNADLLLLIEKLKSDPFNAKKYATLILEIDPSNEDALKILRSENHTTSGGSGGCYVATAVYGSYDCPEVWTLRRFRDNTLAETCFGRAFVRAYYAVSPTLVKLFGNAKWFKAIWKVYLDRMVRALRKKGFESTPYQDRVW